MYELRQSWHIWQLIFSAAVVKGVADPCLHRECYRTAENIILSSIHKQDSAGTDAPVLISLYGPEGKQLNDKPIPLENSSNNFERGREDIFMVEVPTAKDCGLPLTKVSHLGPSC